MKVVAYKDRLGDDVFTEAFAGGGVRADDHALDVEPEERVAPAALVVHFGLGVVAVDLAQPQQAQAVVERLDHVLSEPSNQKFFLLRK